MKSSFNPGSPADQAWQDGYNARNADIQALLLATKEAAVVIAEEAQILKHDPLKKPDFIKV